jgi:hypothetical protein
LDKRRRGLDALGAAANFPQRLLRFRNDRAATSIGLEA